MLNKISICLLALATLPAMGFAQNASAKDALIPIHIAKIHFDQIVMNPPLPENEITTEVDIYGVKVQLRWDPKVHLFQSRYHFPLGDYKVSIPKPNTPASSFDIGQEIDIHMPDNSIVKAYVVGYSE